MAKKKEPENIQWIVTGRVTFREASCVVHAKDRDEAIRKANALDNIDGVDTRGAELCDCDFRHAEADVEKD